jgi:hypothetical protein
MKESRQYVVQGIWLLVAAAMFAGAGLLQGPLDRMSEEAGLVPPPAIVKQMDPKTILLTIAPGGLRAPVLGALWIRADELKNQGKYFDAEQLAEFICAIDPHFTGLWSWQAFNMSYNISVGTHTLEHRWLWVYNGIKLLRDKGIPQNPQSVGLYQELAWIYFHKVGGFMDDYHMGYKARWAAYMQHLLAPPPYGTTEEEIEAFRPIAEAPLDHDGQRQAQTLIQSDKLAEVLRDPEVAAYAHLLAAKGVGVDRSLLDAYNRDSNDECIRAIRPTFGPPRVEASSPDAQAVASLINAPQYAAARGKLLAFVRAQLLWNQYRLDPQWMLGLMEKYGPLDWRLPWSQSIYWATYGFHQAEGTPLETLDRLESLNNSRNILFGLQELTRQGRVTYEEEPNSPDMPTLRLFPDPRFVEPTQREYLHLANQAQIERQDKPEENAFRAGHINYLASAVQMLYVLGRHKEAQEYLQFMRDFYKMTGGEFDLDLEGFVVARLNMDKDVGREVAQTQIGTAIQTSYLLRLKNDTNGANILTRYARRVYKSYQETVPERNRLGPIEDTEAEALAWLGVRPRAVGYNLSLEDRSQLYRLAPDAIRGMIYPQVAEELRRDCANEGIDFARAFPPPGR